MTNGDFIEYNKNEITNHLIIVQSTLFKDFPKNAKKQFWEVELGKITIAEEPNAKEVFLHKGSLQI